MSHVPLLNRRSRAFSRAGPLEAAAVSFPRAKLSSWVQHKPLCARGCREGGGVWSGSRRGVSRRCRSPSVKPDVAVLVCSPGRHGDCRQGHSPPSYCGDPQLHWLMALPGSVEHLAEDVNQLLQLVCEEQPGHCSRGLRPRRPRGRGVLRLRHALPWQEAQRSWKHNGCPPAHQGLSFQRCPGHQAGAPGQQLLPPRGRVRQAALPRQARARALRRARGARPRRRRAGHGERRRRHRRARLHPDCAA
mmetsp:Transcript_54922/g.174593  ORF Transcript_54922/g.174593 Transcript_54922/m.174593 type:complete len:247 (+) Transcript_54922:306-1046(+)